MAIRSPSDLAFYKRKMPLPAGLRNALSRKRRLTMDQARLLHERWHVPAECLLAE